ncbi:MAG: thiamine-phosphate kinase [Proteobacteria bacterium]|nr:thiamine-phosphate kinase [Pseudomonadota bacterium]
MPVDEFGLIDRYFRDAGAQRADVLTGIGDDAAVLAAPPGELVVATDTLVSGVHFPEGSPAQSIGHRALAVNLSDLAAMGATPDWALLALTLPAADEQWLEGFAAGLSALAREHGVALVGGDTTRGPLCVTVQVLGHVPAGTALLRSGAAAGDLLFVSGTPGDAAAGLAIEQGACNASGAQRDYLRQRFLKPTPRLSLGARLRGLASACMDVSDGLLGDAAKLAAASGVAVEIDYDSLPLSPALRAVCGDSRARELALAGGDDYELCFSVAPPRLPQLLARLPPRQWHYTQIGRLTAGGGSRVLRGGTVMQFSHPGYRHFG